MKNISQEYFNTYQLKMPLEISKIIEISDPVYTFSEVLNHIDLKKYLADTKVCLTNSIWAQYWEQDKSEINRLKAWIEDKPELRQKLPDIHTSGHADVASLQKIVEHVQPKCIVPIHTEMPEKYKKLFQSYTVLAVTDETTIDLTNTKE